MVAGVVIVANLIATGPMKTMLDLVTGSGTINKSTSAQAKELAEKIGEEGIALLKNESNALPMEKDSKLNVFGWGSTKPILGGAGSGALNDAYPTTDILTSLKDAGIETNADLTKFYTDYKDARPEVGMFAQDWTLPNPSIRRQNRR
jgi:beta-glucosidase